MNGADALIETLVANEVTACFANPGTSEMQFVSALDRQPAMRPVLCLFEGVATGAADGYGRMTDKPACTLLHLGNVAYRLGRTLTFDPDKQTVVGDEEANRMLRGAYREPYVVPESV